LQIIDWEFLDAHLMVLFDNGTIGNLFATASLHVILDIFTAANLTKLSPAVWGALLFQAADKEARTSLLWE